MSKKIKEYSEFYIKRRNQAMLDEIDSENFDDFEIATDAAIQNHRKELKKLLDIYDEIDNEISENYVKLKSYDTQEQSDLIDKQLFYEDKVNQNKAYLNSLYEMKIIYLSKSLELSINFLIRNAYPSVDLKSFFRWENVKSFLDNKGIAVSELHSYEEYVDLRKVNNCIKHSSIISGSVAKIPEFNKQSTLEYEQLHEFYNRIKVKVPLFIRALKNEIKKDLYDFSDTRLNKLVKEYYERMDEETYLKFIGKMKSIEQRLRNID